MKRIVLIAETADSRAEIGKSQGESEASYGARKFGSAHKAKRWGPRKGSEPT